jgi:hypothetical protein
LEKVGDNSYKLILPPYMCIYSVVNVENIKLYEPSMLIKSYLTIEDLAPDSQEELAKDTVFRRNLELQDKGNMTFGKLG